MLENLLEEWLEQRLLSPAFIDPHSVDLEWALRIYISNTTAGPGDHSE